MRILIFILASLALTACGGGGSSGGGSNPPPPPPVADFDGYHGVWPGTLSVASGSFTGTNATTIATIGEGGAMTVEFDIRYPPSLATATEVVTVTRTTPGVSSWRGTYFSGGKNWTLTLDIPGGQLQLSVYETASPTNVVVYDLNPPAGPV